MTRVAVSSRQLSYATQAVRIEGGTERISRPGMVYLRGRTGVEACLELSLDLGCVRGGRVPCRVEPCLRRLAGRPGHRVR
eukprot:6195867-Pleurochrysis_carterae.AAC.2